MASVSLFLACPGPHGCASPLAPRSALGCWLALGGTVSETPITYSQARTALSCPREHHYAYALGYRPLQTAGALRFGSLFHRSTEAWWRAWGQSAEARLSAAMEAMGAFLEELRAKGDVELDAYELAKARALMVGYHARWVHEPLRPLAVEATFRFPLIHPVTGEETCAFAGQVDAIVQHIHTGEVYLMERKTSGHDITPGSDYWRRLAIDHQVTTYYEGARALGYEVAGCIYDVIGKPKTKPILATPPEARRYKKDGTLYANQRERDETPEEYEARLLAAIGQAPEKYFQRGTISRSDKERDTWYLDMADAAEIIRRDRKTRNPSACRRWGRMCDYFSVCAGEVDISDPLHFRKVETIHEELVESEEVEE